MDARKPWADRANDLHAWTLNNPDSWPSRTSPDAHEASLGRWLSLQRHYAHQGNLKAEHATWLDKHLPGWRNTIGPYGEQAYAALEEFGQQYGHVRVPREYVTSTGLPLGSWLSHRRNDARQGRLKTHDQDRLLALGVRWHYRRPPAPPAVWLDRLRTYQDTYGHPNPPQHYVTREGIRLGVWLGVARRKRRQGQLPADLEQALTALGVDWAPSKRRRTTTST